MPYGTITTLDALAASTTTTVVDFGEDRAWEAINDYFTAHNAIVRDMLMDLADISTDRLRRYGGLDTLVVEEMDQFGMADAQKPAAGQNIGFPLRRHGAALQWTLPALEVLMASELAAQARAIANADLVAVQRQLKLALFTPTNPSSYLDRRVDNLSLPIRRLVNADSEPIPVDPWGNTFDAATHTHYLARAGGSLAASDVSGLIDTVSEHVNTGEIRLYINKAQEAAIRAMTSNFTPYLDARLIAADDTQRAVATLDIRNVNNRPIGIFDEAEVWVKPWVPANYLFAFAAGGDLEKILVFRERFAGRGDLRLVFQDERHPLRAQEWEREYGVGVWSRAGGAVLYAGGTSYTAPSL